jgi:hypothetical protein
MNLYHDFGGWTLPMRLKPIMCPMPFQMSS